MTQPKSKAGTGDLEGKVAVVTGALGLLGQEHCTALAAAGASVVVTDQDAERCAGLAERLARNHRVSTLGVAADVTDAASVATLVARVRARFDAVDVLVNNAAIDDKYEPHAGSDSRFESYPVERFRRVLDVNVTGVFLCCQLIGRQMAERGAGSIINIASTYGVVAPDQGLYRRADGSQNFWKSAAYPTSKGAVLQFTRFLAAYWGGRGVRVNALSPGGVFTEQDPYFCASYAARTPLARMADKSDYRGALLFLASDASAYMTGANLVVDGGFTAC